MANKQITRAEALRDIASIRDRLLTLKEHMEPMSYGLAQQLNICLHSLRTFEDQVRRHYRRANRYWLYHGTQQPDGQAGHQLLGRFPTLISATVAAREWASQWKNPAAHWWHVVDIRTGRIIAESEANP